MLLSMPVAIIVLYALATARITRLVTTDKLTLPPRRAVVRWAFRRRYGAAPGEGLDEELAAAAADNPPALAYLVNCPWCVSVYVGAVVAPLAWFWGTSPWLAVPALALAFSYVTGFLASKEG